jgi:hypothetical protein
MPDRSSSKPLSPDTDRAPAPKFLLLGLMGGLIVWGLYLAIGAAYSGHNVWRGVVVIVCFALFLGWFWGLQCLYARRNRGK